MRLLALTNRDMTWSIIESQELIAEVFNRSQLEKASSSLYAMAQQQLYARYHFQSITYLFDEFNNKYLLNESLVILAHGQDDKREAFETLMVKVGAHALACVLSIHAIADITAFAIFHALGLGLQARALNERDVTAKKIQQCLRKTPEHRKIADLLASLLDDASYKHIAALANHSKHQGLFKPVLNEDWTGKRKKRHEFRFATLQYNNKSFPESELTPLLTSAYNVASKTVINVGKEINFVLRESLKKSNIKS